MIKYRAVIELDLEYEPDKAPALDELETDLHAACALWFYRFEEFRGGVPEEKHLSITVEQKNDM